jgi:Spy/CpxP family protein refolding chaperone
MGYSMTPIISYLQLSPEQQRRITPIDEKFRTDQQATCTEMQDARARLLDVLKKSNATQAELDSALADVSNVQAKLQRRVAEYMLEIKPILTDEQKESLFDLVGQKFCGQGRCGAGICPAGGGPGRYGRCGRM